MGALASRPAARHRAIFISDVHLGTAGAQAELLADFLARNDAPAIYLVGDIIDFWRISSTPYWPPAHNDVVQALLRKARAGTRVVYIPGNHDEAMRRYCGSMFGGVEVVDSLIHLTATGKRLLVIHGDQFDVVVRHARWLALMGDWAYRVALWVSSKINFVRRRAGVHYWSLSAWLKHKVKQAVNYAGKFEEALVDAARRQGADGVVCGHIHHADMRQIGDVLYVNTGDWVESATALVEGLDGRLEIIDWRARQEANMAAALVLPP